MLRVACRTWCCPRVNLDLKIQIRYSLRTPGYCPSTPTQRVKQLSKNDGMERLEVTRLKPRYTYLETLIESS
jgi:hypothetical protein